MSGLTVYTDNLGHQPADTTFTVTNIRFTDGAAGNGLRDGDSSGLQTINGDPITFGRRCHRSRPIVCCVAGGSVVSAVSTSSLIKAIFHSDDANPERSGQPWRLIEAVDTSCFATAGAMP